MASTRPFPPAFTSPSCLLAASSRAVVASAARLFATPNSCRVCRSASASGRTLSAASGGPVGGAVGGKAGGADWAPAALAVAASRLATSCATILACASTAALSRRPIALAAETTREVACAGGRQIRSVADKYRRGAPGSSSRRREAARPRCAAAAAAATALPCAAPPCLLLL